MFSAKVGWGYFFRRHRRKRQIKRRIFFPPPKALETIAMKAVSVR